MRKIFIIKLIIILSTSLFAQDGDDGLVEYADSVFLLFHKNKEIKKDTLNISKTKLYINNSSAKDCVNVYTYHYSFGDFKSELSFFKSNNDSLYLNEPDAILFYLLNESSKQEKERLTTYDGIVEEYSNKGKGVAAFEKNDFIENSGFYKDFLIHDKEYGQGQFGMYLSLATDLDPNWGWRRVDFPAKEISFESFSDKIINKKYSIYKVKIIFVGTSEVDEYDIDRMRVAFFNLYNNELVGDGIVSKKLKIIRD